jgi:predicted TIM-barrel fold metal-dependent hydrolase
MLTRRTFCSLAAGLSTLPTLATGNRTRAQISSGSSGLPAGACDSHVHVIGDPSRFPMSPNREYTPPPATARDLKQSLSNTGFDRVIIVTPMIYGSDNSVTLDAIASLGRQRARGIALIDQPPSGSLLDTMMDGGIVGVRLLLGGSRFNRSVAEMRLKQLFKLAEPRGWHLDISMPPETTAALSNTLRSAPVYLAFDYFGWMAGGVSQAGFRELLSLLDSGRAFIKLSEPYRISKHPPNYEDLKNVVTAYIRTNPDRILWGSGWPHVDSSAGRGKLARNLDISDVHLLRLLEGWVPDARTRWKILVQNPAELYGFKAA